MPERIDLSALGEELRTQDNRITQDPVFVVQQKNRVWGMDSDHADDCVWVNTDNDYCHATPEEATRFDELVEDFEDVPEGWNQIYYEDRWEFVTACFTEKAAQAYIDCNGHNLKEPRIYADSAYRNAEWIGLREYLMGLGPQKRVLTCVFCGEEYPQDTLAWGDEILVDHIKVCPKHPMRAAEETNAKLYAALVGLVGASDPEELNNMEIALRMMAMPSADKINTINAIQALVEAAPARKEMGTG